MGTKSEAAKRSWKQWKPEQARRELEAWRSSGLTLTNYAERRGVTTTRLRYWHARLGEPASSEMRLVPATVMPMPAPMAARPAPIPAESSPMLAFSSAIANSL